MKPAQIAALLLSTAALAAPTDLEVPLGGRAAVRPGRAIQEITVRDPSLVTLIVTDGAVSLEGKKNGTTGVTVTYASGEIERVLVLVGDGQNARGARCERSQTVDLRGLPSSTGQAKVPAAAPKAKDQRKALLNEASDVVRAAVEAL